MVRPTRRSCSPAPPWLSPKRPTSASMISSRPSFQASTNAFDERTRRGRIGLSSRRRPGARSLACRAAHRGPARRRRDAAHRRTCRTRRSSRSMCPRQVDCRWRGGRGGSGGSPSGSRRRLAPALLPVVLAAQPFVLEARAVAVESQRRQGRGRHTGDADRAGDDAGPDSIARHRWHRSRGGRLSSSGSFERVAMGASGVTSRRRWRPHRTGVANGDPARMGSASGAQAEATYEVAARCGSSASTGTAIAHDAVLRAERRAVALACVHERAQRSRDHLVVDGVFLGVKVGAEHDRGVEQIATSVDGGLAERIAITMGALPPVGAGAARVQTGTVFACRGKSAATRCRPARSCQTRQPVRGVLRGIGTGTSELPVLPKTGGWVTGPWAVRRQRGRGLCALHLRHAGGSGSAVPPAVRRARQETLAVLDTHLPKAFFFVP
jgi:hypothetical protein